MTSNTTEDLRTQDRAKEAASAASAAADEGRHVAGVAKEQTAQVASEAAGAAKNVAHDVLRNVSDAAREQSGTQRDTLVGTLNTLTHDLSSMADQAPSGLAGDLARQAADRARSLTSRLEDRDPGDILDDVRRFARRRPGVFLIGALAAGVVTGRLLAGARDGIAGAAALEESNPSRDRGTVSPGAATYVPDPLGSTSLPGQPAYDPTPPPPIATDPDRVDGPETGYSGGGLSGGVGR
jgi:hypothetical protein